MPDPVVYDDAPGKGMAFVAVVDVDTRGGRSVRERDTIAVRGARAVELRIAVATGFRRFDLLPDRPVAEIEATAGKTLATARARSVATLMTAHVADHQRLYRRVALQLERPVGDDTTASRRPRTARPRTPASPRCCSISVDTC